MITSDSPSLFDADVGEHSKPSGERSSNAMTASQNNIALPKEEHIVQESPHLSRKERATLGHYGCRPLCQRQPGVRQVVKRKHIAANGLANNNSTSVRQTSIQWNLNYCTVFKMFNTYS